MPALPKVNFIPRDAKLLFSRVFNRGQTSHLLLKLIDALSELQLLLLEHRSLSFKQLPLSGDDGRQVSVFDRVVSAAGRRYPSAERHEPVALAEQTPPLGRKFEYSSPHRAHVGRQLLSVKAEHDASRVDMRSILYSHLRNDSAVRMLNFLPLRIDHDRAWRHHGILDDSERGPAARRRKHQSGDREA